MDVLNQFSLKNKVIVITGATGVLGKSFSMAIASAGAKVVILGRDTERANERVDAIKADGGEAISIITDMLDEKRLVEAKDEIISNMERLMD